MERGRFGDVIDGPDGPALQAFMQRPDNIVRMETATALKQVAIEPLGPLLLREFGEGARVDRFKQTVGFLARQVLERRGFRVFRNNCRIPRPGLFTSGTRYAPDRSVETPEGSQSVPAAPETGSSAARASSGMDFAKLEKVRRALGLDRIKVVLPPDFDDPAFSRQVLGLDE